jgi:hypothetical protein
MFDLPSYVWALVLLGVIGIPAATSIMLYRGAVAARLGRPTATGVAAVAAAVLGGWIVASWLLARAGVYHQASGEAAPWFGVAFAGTLICTKEPAMDLPHRSMGVDFATRVNVS